MIRTTKLIEYLQLLGTTDIQATDLLAGTGVELEALSDPNYLVDAEQFEAVVMNMIRVTKRSDIAFAIGERFDPSNIGIVGYALLSSRTIRDSMRLWHEYSNPLLGSPLRLVVAEKGKGRWSMAVSPLSRQPELQRFFIEDLLVSGSKLVRMLVGEAPTFQSLALTYPRPPHHALYKKHFDCPIEFGAPATLFICKSPSLDTPIRTNNEELHNVVSQYCQNILQQIPSRGTAEPRIRSLFLTSPGALPDRDAAAQHLGFSRSTLNRRLKNNGGTYGQLKKDFRLDLAKQYLASGHMTQKQISHALGFASASAFCRAFKHWTGKTPGQYRTSGEA